MARRHATQATDRVAGLLYLLRITQLPTYDAGVSDEDAWTRCFHLLPFERKIEMLLDFPFRAIESISKPELKTIHRWFPTWGQLINWPDYDPAYDHTLAPAVMPQNRSRLELVEPATPESSFFVPEIWAIPHAFLAPALEPDEYEVKVGNRTFGFYCPYLITDRKPIETKASQLFTLVTASPESCNWAVCEVIEKRNVMCKAPGGKQKGVGVEVLRKVGVLRTDSCTELFLGAGRSDSILNKINALFI